MRLLNIVTSPRGTESTSRTIVDAFLERLCTLHATIEIDTLHVWEEHLPDFDGGAIGAKYKRVSKAPLNASERAVWQRIEQLAERFSLADRIVVGVPMWNFSYPYKLKQLIDLVTQRNLLFTFDGTRYAPKVEIPRALAVHVRGQSSEAMFEARHPGFEFQERYIAFWLRFIGVQDVREIVVEHTWDAHAHDHAMRAIAEAHAVADHF